MAPQSTRQNIPFDPRPLPAAEGVRPGVSWSAVAAGMATGVAVQVTIYYLAQTLGVGPEAWTFTRSGGFALAVLGAAIPGVVGAWMAGRLCGSSQLSTGALHGFLAWSAATLIGVLVPVSGALALLNSGASAAWNAASSAITSSVRPAGPTPEEKPSKFVYPGEKEPFTATGRLNMGMNPSLTDLARGDAELSEALSLLEWRGGAAESPNDRERVLTLLVEKLGVESTRAEELLLDWDKQLVLARAEREHVAFETAHKASRAAAKVALLGFLALALGGMIAAGGGWSGAASMPRAHTRAIEPAEQVDR